jgi:hypothetical protein
MSEKDISERLYSAFASHACPVSGGTGSADEMASLCYEAKHEIDQLREALMMAFGPGYSDDPMVQQHIETAKTAMNAMNEGNLAFFRDRPALKDQDNG